MSALYPLRMRPRNAGNRRAVTAKCLDPGQKAFVDPVFEYISYHLLIHPCAEACK
jgi:hypothetical protein